MKRYEKYKAAKVNWSNEVPNEWDFIKLKYLYSFEKGKNAAAYTNEYIGMNQGDFPVYSGQTENEGILGKINSYDYDFNTTLLVTTVGAKAMTLRLLQGKFSLSQNCALIINKSEKAFDRFYYYYLQRHFDFEKNSISLIMQPSLRFEDLNTYNVYLPSIPEQTAIANYLDKKTEQIDNLIAQKQRLIELLKEERTAVINQAVTKGINPKVKLKPSGVKWLRDIPEHWEICRLKYFAEVVLGKMLINEDKGDYYLKPYLRAANIQWLNVDISDVKEMWFTKSELIKLRINENDLLVSEGGEVGRTCIWKNELNECYIQNSVHKISFNKKYNPYYFLYQFCCMGSLGYFESIVNRISIGHLTGEKIRELPLCVPSLEEQNKIVYHISEQIQRIVKTLSQIEKEIEHLREYRTALISEVVTGKVKVA
jgi:type I restriction enzyme S subunit